MLDHIAGAAREQWYGAQEAARFLGVHRSTLHIAVRQGLIVPDAYTPGRHARFKHETLEAFRVYLTEHSATSDGRSQASIRALADVVALAARRGTPEELANAAVASIRRALPQVDMCCIAVRAGDPRDRYRMRILAQQGCPAWILDDRVRSRSAFRFVTAAALRSLHPQFCEDTARERPHLSTDELLRTLDLAAYIVQPIVAGDEPLGAVVCLCRRTHTFTDTEHTFIRGISDELATGLARDGQIRQQWDTLTSSSALVRHALFLRARVASRKDDAMNELHARDLAASGQELGDVFKRVSGAEEITALGFGRDLPTSSQHLLLLACQACAGDDMAQTQWSANGITYTGIGASVVLTSGLRAGVCAAWPERRRFPEMDHALLTAFAGAYVLAVDVR